MARCQCAGNSCSCQMTGGPGVTVTGVGSADRPYVISVLPVAVGKTIDPGEPAFYSLGEDGPMGVQSVYRLEFDADTINAYISLPDGSTAYAMPPAGSTVDVFVTGSTDPAAEMHFGGAVINQIGVWPPVGSQQGWYHFVLSVLADGTPIWLGQYVGV